MNKLERLIAEHCPKEVEFKSLGEVATEMERDSGLGKHDRDKVQIIIKGKDRTDDISSWSEADGKIKIIFKGRKEEYPYNPSNVQIKRSVLSNDTVFERFEYLKRIAQTSTIQDSQGNNILANRYNKIDFLDEENMLTAFLTGNLYKSDKSSEIPIIYPFGFNLSQKTAVDKALKNTLTIIEGPLGTGKTQTILNIVANIVMRGESVAVVSSNNSATSNVYEKLEKYHVDFIAALLGNSDNKKIFIDSQKPLPDMSDWKLSTNDKNSIGKSLDTLYDSLSEMLDKKNKLSQIQHKLEEIKVEYEHFNKYCEYSHEQSLLYLKPNATSDVLMKLWFVCEKYVKRGKMPSLFERFINRIFFGIINRPLYLSRKVIKKEFYLADPNMMITICQKCWYIAKISELNDEIALLQKELKNFNFDQKMEEYSTLSLKLFCDYLSNKYKNGKRQMFELDNLWKDSSAFINEYPVILSTTFSLRSSLSSKVMYDYVIIDESSQVDLATGGLALSCAKKAVIVGDIKQLPNVVDGEASSKTDTVFNEFNLPEAYRYKNHSLLHSIIELFPKIPRILLKEHYRCHPKIIEFCNQKFYNNQLIILTESKCDRQPLLVYKTVSGNHARGRINQRQIDMIKEEIILNEKLDDSKLTIGIVTPYRDQTNALQKVFYGTDIQADTVDKFQGRERDVIILSTVDNEITEFTDDANRLNVAISRAIKQLIVVVNGDDNMIGKNIGDLVRYISYNNYEIINSNIHSIFDNLYRMYNEKRASLLQKHGKISEYDSENLIYGLIKDILKDEQFNMFGVTTHVPLKMIIRNMKKLNEEEKKYAQNYLTHVDFLIFDKISKVPRLVIEVDGVAFHGKGTKQEKRDELKNCILEKYGLPYRRFRTDGSSERRKIIEALKSVIKKNPAVSSPTLSATAP